MPSFKTAFGSFLKTEDLQGRAVHVVIDYVGLDTIEGRDGKPDEKKLVAHFKGKDKTLALNKTRCEQLAKIFGTDDYDAWSGPVTLAPGTTKYQGKDVGCIDILARAGAAKPVPVPEPEELDSSDVPF